MYTCLIMHIMSIVEMRMDMAGISYPNRIDCDFKTLQKAIRVTSGENCSIKGIKYRDTISLEEKIDQALEYLYFIIATEQKKYPTTVPESSISSISYTTRSPKLIS